MNSTMSIEEGIFAQFGQVVGRPMASVLQWKERHAGRKAVGYFSSYVPEELLIASGVLPVRMLSNPDSDAVSEADRHMQRWACAYVRGCFDQGLKGYYAPLDGVVFPRTCESLSYGYDVWCYNVAIPWTFFLAVPTVVDTEAAEEFFMDGLRELLTSLGHLTGKVATNEDLLEAIETCNQSRRLLRELYEMRRAVPSPVAGSASLAAVLSGMVLPRDEHNQLLTELLRSLKGESHTNDAGGGGPRLVISGGNLDNPAFLRLVEEQGAEVVCEDISTTTRHFWDLVKLDNNPLQNIARRYLSKIPDASKHPSDRRIEHLMALVNDYRADGVIYWIRLGCESHAIEYPYIRDRLEEKRIPVLYLELEHRLMSPRQTANRIAAFVEMLASEKGN